MVRNNLREWTIIGRCLLILAVIFTVAGACMYYIPAHPQTAQPSSGNIYPKELHGTTIYWKRSEVIAHEILSALAISFFGVGFFLLWRLGLMKRPQ